MKYKLNAKRMVYLLVAILIYAGISLYASVGLGNNIARGVAIHLVLSALTTATVLFMLFHPLERKE